MKDVTSEQLGKLKAFLRNIRGVDVRNLLRKPVNMLRGRRQKALTTLKPPAAITYNRDVLMRYNAEESWFAVIDHKQNTYYVVIPP